MGWLRIHSKHKVNKEEKMTEIEEAKKKNSQWHHCKDQSFD